MSRAFTIKKLLSFGDLFLALFSHVYTLLPKSGKQRAKSPTGCSFLDRKMFLGAFLSAVEEGRECFKCFVFCYCFWGFFMG
jgi:hypothetical protein